MNGIVVNLFLKTAHGSPMDVVRDVTADSGKGLVGDASYGRKNRQVLLIERETLDEFGLQPGQVRENITVSNIHLAGLPQGKLILVGTASLEVTGDCAPCQLIEDIKPGLRSEMDQRRGILCEVKDGGSIQVGDIVVVLE